MRDIEFNRITPLFVIISFNLRIFVSAKHGDRTLMGRFRPKLSPMVSSENINQFKTRLESFWETQEFKYDPSRFHDN